MGIRRGSISTPIIVDGLVFNVDAANRASYPRTGTTATDTINYDVNTNNTGTFSNSNSSTFFSTDKGGIFLFDGIDDYITVNGSTNSGLNRPGITNQITLESWCYTRTFNNNYERIIARRVGTTPLPYMFGFHTVSGNKYDLYLSGTNSYGPASLNSTTNVILNEWVHFVGTSDNSTRKIYLNGVLDNSDSYSSGIFSTDINLQIGAQSSGYNYNGDIGAVRIYDRALSANEVLHNYNALKSRFE
tara:strand:+ start:1094 stop:1828 length:735 start_codon:yes stop_codon:yes gene_type:complete